MRTYLDLKPLKENEVLEFFRLKKKLFKASLFVIIAPLGEESKDSKRYNELIVRRLECVAHNNAVNLCKLFFTPFRSEHRDVVIRLVSLLTPHYKLVEDVISHWIKEGNDKHDKNYSDLYSWLVKNIQ